MKILLTRPAGDSERTAARLSALGHEPVIAPLMEIASLPAELPAGQVQAVVLTSANAARAVSTASGLQPLLAVSAFPVGERTAETARAAGFAEVAPPAGDGRALAGTIAQACRPDAGLILHPGGRDLAVDIAALLREQGFDARHLAVYEARPAETLPEAAAARLRARDLDAVLLYSPRSARLLLDLAAKAGLSDELRRIVPVVMSEAVAEPLRRAGHSRIEVACDNSESGLFAALDRISGGGS